jgi:hypothetical protein
MQRAAYDAGLISKESAALGTFYATAMVLGGFGASLGLEVLKWLYEMFHRMKGDPPGAFDRMVESYFGKDTFATRLLTRGLLPGSSGSRLSPFGSALPTDISNISNIAAPAAALVRVEQSAAAFVNAFREGPESPTFKDDMLDALAKPVRAAEQLREAFRASGPEGYTTQTGGAKVARSQLTNWDIGNLAWGYKTEHLTTLLHDAQGIDSIRKQNDGDQKQFTDQLTFTWLRQIAAAQQGNLVEAQHWAAETRDVMLRVNAWNKANAAHPERMVDVRSVKSKIVDYLRGVDPRNAGKLGYSAARAYVGNDLDKPKP